MHLSYDTRDTPVCAVCIIFTICISTVQELTVSSILRLYLTDILFLFSL